MGLVHLAHAAAADEPDDAIALSDDVADGERLREASRHGNRQPGDGAALEDTPFDFGAQAGVVRALAVEERAQFFQRQVECRVDQR